MEVVHYRKGKRVDEGLDEEEAGGVSSGVRWNTRNRHLVKRMINCN